MRSLAPCASTGSRCWPREVEHERRDVVRHGVVARRRTVPALPIADLRHAGFHRVDEVREVPAEVVGRELLALDHRQEPFDGTAFLARPSPGAQITFSTVFIARSTAAFESRRFPSLRWRRAVMNSSFASPKPGSPSNRRASLTTSACTCWLSISG